jgi:hypothetical protein
MWRTRWSSTPRMYRCLGVGAATARHGSGTKLWSFSHDERAQLRATAVGRPTMVPAEVGEKTAAHASPPAPLAAGEECTGPEQARTAGAPPGTVARCGSRLATTGSRLSKPSNVRLSAILGNACRASRARDNPSPNTIACTQPLAPAPRPGLPITLPLLPRAPLLGPMYANNSGGASCAKSASLHAKRNPRQRTPCNIPRNATPNTTATHYPNLIQNATQLPMHISTWPQHAAHNGHWRSLLEGHRHAHRPAREVDRTAQGPPPARMHHAPPAFRVLAHTRPTKLQAGSGAPPQARAPKAGMGFCWPRRGTHGLFSVPTCLTSSPDTGLQHQPTPSKRAWSPNVAFSSPYAGPPPGCLNRRPRQAAHACTASSARTGSPRGPQ